MSQKKLYSETSHGVASRLLLTRITIGMIYMSHFQHYLYSLHSVVNRFGLMRFAKYSVPNSAFNFPFTQHQLPMFWIMACKKKLKKNKGKCDIR